LTNGGLAARKISLNAVESADFPFAARSSLLEEDTWLL
jgi:predicted methyltransferase MtxX (methanogen marker protein 4)